MSEVSPVCILGCGRSGTSIFGELFQSLPAFEYYSEPDLDSLWSIDWHQTPTQTPAIKVPRPHSHNQTSEGLPFKWPDFLDLFPKKPVIFWQVRHPLDTICSLKVGIARNWGHHPRPRDWQQWLGRPLVEQCAHHWNYLNTVGYEQVKPYARVSHFEDMIAQPLAFAQSNLAVTGLDYQSVKNEVEMWAVRVQNSNNEKFVEAECSRAYSTQDHKQKVGRWRENLSLEEVTRAIPIVQAGARNFNYRLPDLEAVVN